ncbi:response regulator transcription factor [Streptomyces sp. NBS 14/10]|uniref:response regulator transcription factor n=1 Tax=Streptomyces sp. NBS 14/10 TaxID=1945643 RepID=UPI000B7DE55D|nr:response regulator transcription factor [Streptomyces sp. NBS 14/10]KAK1179018.1 response regulator transcription factor [Streptomyces sp. NBS 14/10]NUP44730.1 response regulator transcription factor [Streptomyces sp.]NUS81481.1 response regulator transcription factor [Streptomyces sp.]
MRILVVEDDARLRELLKEGLEQEGFTVETAGDGRGGLGLALSTGYAAIVLDVMLPGLSGYQVCSRLREAGVWTPILMLTAKDGEYDEADGLDVGADDYLTKPFSFVVLIARIRALVRRGGLDRPEVLELGDLRLEPAALACSRGKDSVTLTAKEFAVLECLARRAGQVVSKTEIVHTVWDTAYEGGANLVEVYIRALRRKIDVPYGRQAIRTIRGAGYLLARDGG